MSETAQIHLSKLGQIAVRARDLDRAVAFYRDRLRMRFLFQVPKMAFFDCDGVRLMLAIPEGPELDHPGSILYYRVEDIRRAFEVLKERGVGFTDEPHRVADLGQPRAVDDLLPGPGGERPGPHERDPQEHPRHWFLGGRQA